MPFRMHAFFYQETDHLHSIRLAIASEPAEGCELIQNVGQKLRYGQAYTLGQNSSAVLKEVTSFNIPNP